MILKAQVSNISRHVLCIEPIHRSSKNPLVLMSGEEMFCCDP